MSIIFHNNLPVITTTGARGVNIPTAHKPAAPNPAIPEAISTPLQIADANVHAGDSVISTQTVE